MISKKIKTIILLFLLSVTLLFRAYGLNSHTEVDENYEVKRALNVLEGEFDWSRILKGGLYILLVPIYFVASLFNQDYYCFLLIGRIVQVIIGTVLIVFLYYALKILYGDRWALFFILPPIFNAQLIYTAHHVNVQNLMFLGVIIHLFFIIRYFETNEYKLLCKSLIPLSVAISSQISSVIVTIPFLIFCLISIIKTNRGKRRDVLTNILKYGLISLGIYMLLTPGIVIYSKSIINNVANKTGLSEDITPSDFKYNLNLWSEYTKYILNFFGKLNLILIFTSIFIIFIKKKWFYIYPLSIFMLFYLIFANASQTVYNGRYIIPGLLMGFIIMPLSVVEWTYWLNRYKNNIRYLLLGITIVLITLNYCRIISFSLEGVKKYALSDTRDLISEWLGSNTTIDDRIMLQRTPNFPRVPYEEQAVYINNWNACPGPDKIDVDYIILSKSLVDYFQSKKVKVKYVGFFHDLVKSKKWELVHMEKPVWNKSTGPELRVYHRIEDL